MSKTILSLIIESSKEDKPDQVWGRKTAIIKIPSAIIPNEFNYIVNPLHAKHKSFKIINIADYAYDLRIKTS